MRWLLVVLLALLSLLLAFPLTKAQQAHVASTPPRSPEEERALLRVPPGFEVQLVAAEPLIRKPMNLAFDERGRLWVTDTIEYPFPAPKDRPGRDSIKILEDFDENGRARKVTTFADGLNIPIGIMPVQNGVIVFSIPNVYRLLDTDGDGKADKRDVLYGPFGYEDTHGNVNAFTWGFDGWLYACHGFRNTSTIQGTDGSAITMQSGNVFRMRPDGSRVEQFTWGQVNPFGLSFDPLGNLYSADCHSKPLMMLLRGGHYQSFGKPHDGLGFAPEICAHQHGSTAISGVVHYAADQFPSAYRDTVFLGNVVTNRINHDRLERRGSTFRAVEQADFLVSGDPWFRPVDLKLGPDGALYVADFYNRIIGHYEVPLTHPGRDRERGRIWRIAYRGTEGAKRPDPQRRDLTRAPVRDLIEDLANPNLVLRIQAANQLTARGGTAAPPVRALFTDGKSSPEQRAHGLWVLERLGEMDEGTLLAQGADAQPLVRVHVARVLSERPRLLPVLRHLLFAFLKDPDAVVRRVAADALGRHPSPDNVSPLLELRRSVPAEDTQLLHTVRMALREQLRADLTWPRLDTMGLNPGDLSVIADVALGVPSPSAAQFLLAFLERHLARPEDTPRFVHHIARRGTSEVVQRGIVFAQKDRPDDMRHQAALVRAIQQGTQERGASLDAAAVGWAGRVVDRLLDSQQGRDVQVGLELTGSLRLDANGSRIETILADRKRPEDQRAAALATLAAIRPREYLGLFGQTLSDPSEPLGLRDRAAQTLASLNSPESRGELAKHLPAAPARLQNAIAVGLAGTREGAETLLEIVATGKASARLLQEPPVVARLNSAKPANLSERLAKLTAGLPAADQRLQKLVLQRTRGYAATRPDEKAGLQVFEKHCANCHQLQGKGAKIGPQLDGIGVRGIERLLEDILDPSRNVDQAFRTTLLALTNGQVVSGLLLREEGEVLVVADNQGKELRIAKGTVAERTSSPLSPMPANVAEQVPEPEFYHLMAYLLKQRVEKPK